MSRGDIFVPEPPMRRCRETLAEVQMKALEEFDMKKKHAEITHRQKEFGSMYPPRQATQIGKAIVSVYLGLLK